MEDRSSITQLPFTVLDIEHLESPETYLDAAKHRRRQILQLDRNRVLGIPERAHRIAARIKRRGVVAAHIIDVLRGIHNFAASTGARDGQEQIRYRNIGGVD